MKWFIGFTILCGIGFVLILRAAIKDASKNMSNDITRMYDEIDEHSPENLDDVDRTLSLLSLKNKLKKIEEERETEIDDVNLDYSREDGK